MISIQHDRENGTLVYGTRRGDGAGRILKANGFRPSRNLPDGAYWYLPHSRDHRAKTWNINQAADALQAAGFEVEIEIDNVTAPSTSFVEREAERNAMAADRAERFRDRADRASAAGERMWEEVQQQWQAIPLGQPLLVDHYSYKSDRNRRERWHRKEGRAIEEIRRGEYWQQRAGAAEQYQQHREGVPTTLRRIERLEERQRRIARTLEGRKEWFAHESVAQHLAELAAEGIEATEIARDDRYGVLIHVPVSAEYATELRAEAAQITEEIAAWKEHVARAEADGVKVWRREDFVKGGFVRQTRGGVWLEIIRVNAKSVTVPWIIMAVGAEVWTVEDAKACGRGLRDDGRPYTDTIPYHKIVDYLSPQDARRRWPARFADPLGESR